MASKKRVAKFNIDKEKLMSVLEKETSVTKIVEQMGLPKEAKPYVFNAIKRIGAVKVKPGVYKLA